MWKRFTAENTRKWIDMLDKLMKEYNNRVHSTIGMTPIEASKEDNEIIVSQNTLNKTKSTPRTKSKFKIDDKVQISKTKAIFEKGYLPNWSEELYTIDKVQKKIPSTYKLKNLLGEEIEGSICEQELQKVTKKFIELRKLSERRKFME